MKQLAALVLLTAASPAFAGGASAFTLVNGTGSALGELSIRRAGTNDWKSLGAAPSPGAQSSVKFTDPDCAFDLSAKVGGSTVVWTGVNLCDVKAVTLKRDSTTGAWVDYD